MTASLLKDWQSFLKAKITDLIHHRLFKPIHELENPPNGVTKAALTNVGFPTGNCAFPTF